MPAPKVTAEELKELVKQRLSVEEMADIIGMTVPSLRNRLSKLKLSPARPDRKWAVPGQVTLAASDSNTYTLRNLWVLAAVADGEPRDLGRLTTAVNWATALMEAGKDIRYERKNPPGKRWVTFDANPNAWHIRMVLESAKARRRLSLEDVID